MMNYPVYMAGLFKSSQYIQYIWIPETSSKPASAPTEALLFDSEAFDSHLAVTFGLFRAGCIGAAATSSLKVTGGPNRQKAKRDTGIQEVSFEKKHIGCK